MNDDRFRHIDSEYDSEKYERCAYWKQLHHKLTDFKDILPVSRRENRSTEENLRKSIDNDSGLLEVVLIDFNPRFLRLRELLPLHIASCNVLDYFKWHHHKVFDPHDMCLHLLQIIIVLRFLALFSAAVIGTIITCLLFTTFEFIVWQVMIVLRFLVCS